MTEHERLELDFTIGTDHERRTMTSQAAWSLLELWRLNGHKTSGVSGYWLDPRNTDADTYDAVYGRSGDLE